MLTPLAELAVLSPYHTEIWGTPTQRVPEQEGMSCVTPKSNITADLPGVPVLPVINLSQPKTDGDIRQAGVMRGTSKIQKETHYLLDRIACKNENIKNVFFIFNWMLYDYTYQKILCNVFCAGHLWICSAVLGPPSPLRRETVATILTRFLCFSSNTGLTLLQKLRQITLRSASACCSKGKMLEAYQVENQDVRNTVSICDI